MSEDDLAYKRSVRNMALVLAAIVVVVFAAILLPPIINPVHEQFVSSTSTTSPYGFTLNLRLNSSSIRSGNAVSATAWLNSTAPQLENVTAVSAWLVGPAGLWTKPCTSGWPLGVGVMQGYFTSDNFTLGTLVRIPAPLGSCPVSSKLPSFFIFQPLGSNALVESGGSATMMNLTSTLTFVPAASGVASPGVYTVVGADEWGDVVLVHFVVSA